MTPSSYINCCKWFNREIHGDMLAPCWSIICGNHEALPFYYVQITPHKGQNAEIREAQLMSLKTIPNSGMVVTTDVGDAQNIHPIDKQTVGYRLALIARAKTYGENKLVHSGPIFNHMKIKKQKAQLLVEEALAALRELPYATDELVALARYVIARQF